MPATRREALRLLGSVAVAGTAGCGALDTRPDPNERPPSSLGAAPQSPADDWRHPAGDAGHTAHTAASPPAEPKRLWSRVDRDGRDSAADAGDDGRDSAADAERLHGDLAAVVDDRVVTVTDDDTGTVFRAFAAGDGERNWRRRVPRADESHARRVAGVADGALFLTDGCGALAAVAVADGTVRWRRSLFDQVAGAVPAAFLGRGDRERRRDRFGAVAAVTPDELYVASAYGLHGVTLADGTETWRLHLGEDVSGGDGGGGGGGGGGDSTPSPGRPTGVAPTPDGAVVTDRRRGLVAVDGYETADDGFETTVSRESLPFDAPGHPVVAGGATVVAPAAVWSTGPVRPVVAGGFDGRHRWSFAGDAGGGASAHAAPATDGDRVFVCSAHESTGRVAVTALRAATGALVWHRSVDPGDAIPGLGDRPLFRVTPPVVADDTLLVGFGSDPEGAPGTGALLGLSVGDGAVRWRRSVSVGPRRVAVADGRVFVVGFRGGVVAFGGG